MTERFNSELMKAKRRLEDLERVVFEKKKQESKEYQEAVELIAKLLAFQFIVATPDEGMITTREQAWAWVLREGRAEEFYEKARELLQQTYPCEKCSGLGLLTKPGCTSCAELITCPSCKGTGQSNVKVLAVRARNQEVPHRLYVKDNPVDAYRQGQQDMVAWSFIKVVEE